MEVRTLNSWVIDWLNKRFGCSISRSYYDTIEEWEHWWKGFHEPFHKIKVYDGTRHRSREMYTMKMAKKICEDWASLLINDKTKIKVEDEHTSEWLQGENELGGVLGSNNFWEQANDLMERMMYSGTAAIVIGLRNARFTDDGQLLSDPDNRIDLDYISAESIVPLSCDNGIITEAAFCSDISVMGKSKLYLQIHRSDNGEYVIENHLFGVESANGSLLAEEELPDNIPEIIHTGSAEPWFAICKPALVNTERKANGMGCAIFSNAIDNLKGVDIAYNNFNSDFWLGQKKVFINKSLIADLTDSDGNTESIVPDDVNQQLFYTIGMTMGDENERPLVQEHNPDLRVSDNTAGVQAQLDYLSFKVGFGTKHYQFNSGSIVTATQYTGDKQDLIQNAHKHFIKVEGFMQRLMRTLLYIGHNYIDSSINPDTKIEIMFDQSPLIDENAERARDLEAVNANVMLPWEWRVKYLGETREQAEEILSSVQEDDDIMGFGGSGEGDE